MGKAAKKGEEYFKFLSEHFNSIKGLVSSSDEIYDLMKFAVTMAYIEGHLDATNEAITKIGSV